MVTGDGTCSLRISSTSTNGADYSSKEGANAPQLVLTLGGTPAPTNTPTPGPSPTPTRTPTPTAPVAFSSAAFVYDGDGKRVKSILNGTITTYFVGAHYEVTGSTITKYYYAGSQRIAMRTNGTLNYLLGDHLGSTSLTTSATGAVISELRYKAWGETRYASGATATKYTYTGQYSYTADFGLMFYNARWYDSSLGRFAQADTIIPESSQGVQAWDRYAYTSNNPIKYIDPSGNNGCSPTDVQCVQNDLGLTFTGGFTDQELTTIVEAAYKMLDKMGGSADFKKELGGVNIIKDDIDVGGYGNKNKVQLNKNGGWDDWTVVHELAHSWDAANSWGLSKDLEKETGGRTSWFQGIKVRLGFSGCGDFQASGCNNAGYYYGDIPAKGSDRGFNRKEDFAESVTTYVLGQDRAKQFINSYYPNVAYLHYSDYTQTSRWKYVDKLMVR